MINCNKLYVIFTWLPISMDHPHAGTNFLRSWRHHSLSTMPRAISVPKTHETPFFNVGIICQRQIHEFFYQYSSIIIGFWNINWTVHLLFHQLHISVDISTWNKPLQLGLKLIWLYNTFRRTRVKVVEWAAFRNSHANNILPQWHRLKCMEITLKVPHIFLHFPC